MSCVARVLVVENDPALSAPLIKSLNARGYRGTQVADSYQAFRHANTDRPDVVMVDGVDAIDDDFARKMVKNDETRGIPIIVIVDPNDYQATTERFAGSAFEFLPRPFGDAELFARLDHLVRLSTMEKELRQRIATLHKFGVHDITAVNPLSEVTDPKVLVAGSRKQEIGEVAALLGETISLAFCTTGHDALRRLNQEQFDALLVTGGDENVDVLHLCDDVRDNPRLYNLPILVLAQPDLFADPAEPYRCGANDVLFAPWKADDLVHRTMSLVRQHRYRTGLQRLFREARRLQTCDYLTGLYNYGFLMSHLTSLVHEAHRLDKNLSVGVVKITGVDDVNRAYGYDAGDRLLQQIGGLSVSLVRGEDLTARLSGNEVCIVMPDAAPEVANFAVTRTAGVIASTEFAIDESETGLRVKLTSGCASLEHGDDPTTLLARARETLC